MVASGTAAVCGRGASAQTTSVVQIAQTPNPESRPRRLKGLTPLVKISLSPAANDARNSDGGIRQKLAAGMTNEKLTTKESPGSAGACNSL